MGGRARTPTQKGPRLFLLKFIEICKHYFSTTYFSGYFSPIDMFFAPAETSILRLSQYPKNFTHRRTYVELLSIFFRYTPPDMPLPLHIKVDFR